MEMFEVQSKKGGARSLTHPLIEAEHDSEASEVYTPIEEREAEGSSMMSSAMSRISIEAISAPNATSPQASRSKGEKKDDRAVYNSRSAVNVEVKDENVKHFGRNL